MLGNRIFCMKPIRQVGGMRFPATDRTEWLSNSTLARKKRTRCFLVLPSRCTGANLPGGSETSSSKERAQETRTSLISSPCIRNCLSPLSESLNTLRYSYASFFSASISLYSSNRSK